MQQEQITLDSWCGKTCPEHSAAMEVTTSEPSLKKPRECPTAQYQYLDLREGGQILGAFWATDLAYHGAQLTHNTSESPKDADVSTLSQILEDNPLPKYFLSSAAVCGILRRARRRGKELPEMLQSALISQSNFREDTYGQKEIAYAGKVLRSLRDTVGQTSFEEWIRGAIILVQSEKVLLYRMFGETSHNDVNPEDGKTFKIGGEQNDSCIELRDLRKIIKNAGSSQGQKSHEQLAGQLNQIVLELSRQTAPNEVFLRCLRSADEGTGVMHKTLSGIQEILKARMGHAIHEDVEKSVICLQGNGIDRADTAGCNGKGWTEDVCCTLNTVDRPAVFSEVGIGKFAEGAGTLRGSGGSCGGGSENLVVTTIDYRNMVENIEISVTLQAKENGGQSLNYQNPVRIAATLDCSYADKMGLDNQHVNAGCPNFIKTANTVRRLTPLECERLQGYPDFFTNIPGASDSARYKALGNSFAVPCAEFVIRGIVETMNQREEK